MIKLPYKIPIKEIPDAEILSGENWDVENGTSRNPVWVPSAKKKDRNGFCYEVRSNTAMNLDTNRIRVVKNITGAFSVRNGVRHGWSFHGGADVSLPSPTYGVSFKDTFFKTLVLYNKGRLVCKVLLDRDFYNPEDIIVTRLDNYAPTSHLPTMMYYKHGTHLKISKDRKLLSFGKFNSNRKSGIWFEEDGNGATLKVTKYTPAKVNGMQSIEKKGVAVLKDGVYNYIDKRESKLRMPIIRVGKLKLTE